MPTNYTNHTNLSARLALLACDVDELVQQITAEPQTNGDTIVLAAPAPHLAIALENLENLEDALYQAEKRPVALAA